MEIKGSPSRMISAGALADHFRIVIFDEQVIIDK